MAYVLTVGRKTEFLHAKARNYSGVPSLSGDDYQRYAGVVVLDLQLLPVTNIKTSHGGELPGS